MLSKIILAGFILLLIIILYYISVTKRPEEKGEIIKPKSHVGANKSVILGSCRILEEKYCRRANHVTIEGNTTTTFKLPPEVPIFSPFAGVVTIGFPATEPGSPRTYNVGKVSYITISEGVSEKDRAKKDRRSVVITYTGVEEEGIKSGSMVKKGEILARTGRTNIDTQKIFEKYNLAAVLTKEKTGIREYL